MSLRTANLLTIGGFCTLYFGLMGILMAINVPVSSDARKPAVLVLGALALAGLAVMSVGSPGGGRSVAEFPMGGSLGALALAGLAVTRLADSRRWTTAAMAEIRPSEAPESLMCRKS